MKDNLTQHSMTELHTMLTKKEVSVHDVLEAYMQNIEARNRDINAYLEVFDDVVTQADAAQLKIDSGEAGVFTGIPIGIKDNILIKGRHVSAASKILEGYRATYDATVIEKMKKDAPIFLGRLNCDEFAMGGSTENSAFGVTKNPLDEMRVSGGSSGGSAAAVAMGGAAFTLGSDTGGSIRQPASFCGVVGLKPTYGSVSRHGLIAMASSLDVIGPLTKTVADAEKVFDGIRGHDGFDSTTLAHDTYAMLREKKREGKRIGVPRNFVNQDGIDEETKERFEEALTKLQNEGYDIVDIEIPNLEHVIALYYIIMPAEASSNLARFDGMKYGLSKEGADLLETYRDTRADGFGDEVRRRILIGTYVLSAGYYNAYYKKATALRDMLKDSFKNVFEDVDLIAMPTTPNSAFRIGEKTTDPLTMYLEDIFTVGANLVGVPAMSLPAGMSQNMPVGLQLLGPHGREDLLFVAGKKFLGEA